MNELAIRHESALTVSLDTKELIKASVLQNTLRAYRRALDSLAEWLDAELNDAVLAKYVTQLHQSGKAKELGRGQTVSLALKGIITRKWGANRIEKSQSKEYYRSIAILQRRRQKERVGTGRRRGVIREKADTGGLAAAKMNAPRQYQALREGDSLCFKREKVWKVLQVWA